MLKKERLVIVGDVIVMMMVVMVVMVVTEVCVMAEIQEEKYRIKAQYQ